MICQTFPPYGKWCHNVNTLQYIIPLQKLVEQFLQKASTTKALRKDVIIGRENKVEIVKRDDCGGIPVDINPSHDHYYLWVQLYWTLHCYFTTCCVLFRNIPLSESFTAESGVIAIASQQIRGKGLSVFSYFNKLSVVRTDW